MGFKVEPVTADQFEYYRWFANLPKEKKYEIIQGLTPEESFHLQHTWEAWARNKQLEPEGDYSTWLILAGRGFGKSRTGAEWVRKQVEAGKYSRLAIVGRTAADVRDVMLYGESGLITNSHPNFMPKHEGGRRRLVWPNGATATTYSAEEPNSMRGPQHDAAWCLAGHTLVLMSDGTEKPISEIRVGEYVQTRRGNRRVLQSGMVHRNASVRRMVHSTGNPLVGTAKHLVWTKGHGFAPLQSILRGTGLSSGWCEEVEEVAAKQGVYDISVEDCHEFYANGVLVHNCDEICAWRTSDSLDQLMLGLRLGPHPRVVLTTTPRATKEIKSIIKMPTTYVTNGTTYENRDNLAQMFFDQVIRRYEHSRLGRQELLAELLDDAEGALWKRTTMIDPFRVTKAPDLVRIVVGVDPATTSEENSDETGIIVAGRGADGHLYILDDLSLRASPQEWAMQAVSAYYKYAADRIIGESNQGGDMVETTIRMVDKYVAYKKVHSKRGKYARAEPIAALYEQGRGHHVGILPQLEDELCSWEQGISESPDRLDALVHASTELMLEGYFGGGGVITLDSMDDEEFNPFW